MRIKCKYGQKIAFYIIVINIREMKRPFIIIIIIIILLIISFSSSYRSKKDGNNIRRR